MAAKKARSVWEPSDEQARFVKKYSASLQNGDVAAFVGAGLSNAAGYVDWRGLLKTVASDVGLDVRRERDLVAVAQYHLNEKRSRAGLNQAIVDSLTSGATPSRSHKILARMPLPVVWTTNYDQLLE